MLRPMSPIGNALYTEEENCYPRMSLVPILVSAADLGK